MRKFICFAVILLFPLPSFAFENGKQALEYCKVALVEFKEKPAIDTIKMSGKAAFCLGMIGGASQTFNALKKGLNREEKHQLRKTEKATNEHSMTKFVYIASLNNKFYGDFCPPRIQTSQNLARIFVTYLERTPKKMDWYWLELLFSALKEEYPCYEISKTTDKKENRFSKYKNPSVLDQFKLK